MSLLPPYTVMVCKVTTLPVSCSLTNVGGGAGLCRRFCTSNGNNILIGTTSLHKPEWCQTLGKLPQQLSVVH